MNEIKEISNIIINEKEETENNKYSWEIDGKRIINSSKKYLTNEDIIIIKSCFNAPLPDDLREEYWYIITGAKQLKIENPTYYTTILNNYPKNPLSEKMKIKYFWTYIEHFPKMKISEKKK